MVHMGLHCTVLRDTLDPVFVSVGFNCSKERNRVQALHAEGFKFSSIFSGSRPGKDNAEIAPEW